MLEWTIFIESTILLSTEGQDFSSDDHLAFMPGTSEGSKLQTCIAFVLYVLSADIVLDIRRTCEVSSSFLLE